MPLARLQDLSQARPLLPAATAREGCQLTCACARTLAPARAAVRQPSSEISSVQAKPAALWTWLAVKMQGSFEVVETPFSAAVPAATMATAMDATAAVVATLSFVAV